MTTTAFDDQFAPAPEPLRQPYDTVTILRRNVADLEIALRKQAERTEAAEKELAKLREQKPVAWCDADGDFYSGESYPNVWPSAVPLYAAPVPAPAVLEEWRKFVGFLAQQTTFPHPAVCICQACTWIKKARALLQSAEVTDNAAADRLMEGE